MRILDQGHGTDAVTRVLIETSDGESSWVTVGVGANVIEASWGALVDGMTFGLRRHERLIAPGQPRVAERSRSMLEPHQPLRPTSPGASCDPCPPESCCRCFSSSVGVLAPVTSGLARTPSAVEPRARTRGPTWC